MVAYEAAEYSYSSSTPILALICGRRRLPSVRLHDTHQGRLGRLAGLDSLSDQTPSLEDQIN